MERQKSPHLPPPPPPESGQPTQAEGKWTTGLCDCFDDIPICCLTCYCPCITFGQIAEIVDKGSVSCTTSGAFYMIILMFFGCPNCYSCFYRSKMRKQFLLPESPCGDCLVHCCCETCALCQEHRELKNRGYNMALGWQGINVERQNRGDVGMVPPPPIGGQGMAR